ncbi:MAG TPA: S1/P1 nuclease [Allosphingosinicella sp.]|uniref:S1/P1 nuclease n=1 Tax=Allosphingosinicella sp. TaxID=2823234 RepID=UPI002EDB3A50
MLKLRTLLLGLALALAASPAGAWWEYGHYSVGRIAFMEVKPSTRAELNRLMKKSGLLDTPTCPATTIEEVSYWPDCIKTLGDRFSYASSWHYQNVDVCKPFDQKSACRDGNCVSAQIDRNAKLLADKTLPERERLMALAFLVHFVGDLHMPLHAGDKGDLGGNRFRASYGAITGRNLHAIWDGYLADRGISNPPGNAAGVLSEVSTEQRAAWRTGTTEDWAREGWEAARQFAYGSVMEDPCGAAPETEPVIDEATTRRLIPVIRERIAKGGLRLARLLDEALA